MDCARVHGQRAICIVHTVSAGISVEALSDLLRGGFVADSFYQGQNNDSQLITEIHLLAKNCKIDCCRLSCFGFTGLKDGGDPIIYCIMSMPN